MSKLSALRKLVSEGIVSPDEMAIVDRLEDEWLRAIEVEELGKHPVIKQFIAALQTQLKAIDTQLSTRRELTTEQRETMFNKKDVFSQFMEVFQEGKKAQIEDEINKAYTNATS